jgi:tetratricopeptide (TPR) repeat protein
MGLLLAAVDVAGPSRWRWLLSDEETGNLLADHPVNLDPAWDDVARFSDLYGYVRSYAAPDRRTEDGARFVNEAGAWAGRELLGEPVAAAILAEAPVAVQVRVPAALDFVLLWPLELAHAAGRPLAAQGDVTLVYDIAPDAPARRKSEIGVTLRMLAVFSQPMRTSVLALRRERHALSQLIRRIAGRERARVELRVVQYGVTRERLEQIADFRDGWDVLHLSGHGAGGVFVLEKPDGSPDLVSTADLAGLLRPVRRRVRLAVVSACESAADTTAETLRLIGLTEQADAVAAESGEHGATQIPGLARALVRELDCAVVAMRCPVTDEFAIAFGDVFYEHLFSRRQPVDVAAARALTKAAGPVPSAARPAVSLATPGVFGARAAGLTLPVPRGRPELDPAERRMAYFLAEPARFVGRAGAMARASAALSSGSGRTAVLLHGMAGAGKTACALELAYRHADAFAALAFWQAPARQEEWASALPDFANRLDIQLGDYGFEMASHIGTVADLDKFLPRLRQVMEDGGVLMVLDNLETLLTPEGGWRDPRWGQLVSALTGHNGETRVIMTSRILPSWAGKGTGGPAGPGTGGLVAAGPAVSASAAARVVTLPIHALSLEEAAALARELPNLRRLLHADPGPVRATAGTDAEADRERVRRVLRVVQGHPKLMELADAAAADRDRLDAQLAAAEEAAPGQGNTVAGRGLEAFFRDGASTLDPDQFLGALTGWTVTALGVLPAAARLMAEFVACLEDGDRQSGLIEATWAQLWEQLGRPGDPPAPGPLLAALAAAALAEAVPVTGQGDQASAGDQAALVAYRLHPGVAAAVVAAAGPGVREAVDAVLAASWAAVAEQVSQHEGGEDSRLVVRAGLAAAPYLLRRGDWDTARTLLDHALLRDGSPGTVQAALPPLRRVAAATGTPEASRLLASALRSVDPAEAERLLRDALDAAVGAGDYRAASGLSGDLVNLLKDAGRLREALAAAGQAAEYTRRAGLGPWTQLADEARRLQVLGLMGGHARVLAEVTGLRARMAGLPDDPAAERAVPWNVREVILDAGYASAMATGDAQRCLDLNAEIAASQRRRGAGEHEITRTRFRDAWPLTELGRLAEAGRLLAECQQVFEDHADITGLAAVLSERGDLEAGLGHWQAAADFQQTALRYRYAHPEPRGIAHCHHNFAIYLGRLGGDRTVRRAHRLAAALILRLAGMTQDLADCVRVLAAELREDGDSGELPATVAEVVRIAELTEGVRLGDLLATLQPDPRAVEDALTEILRAAAALPPEDSERAIMRHLQEWEPMIADIAAACRAGEGSPAELSWFLDELAKEPDWAALAGVQRRILAGERGEILLDGLKPVHTAIARETLARLKAN